MNAQDLHDAASSPMADEEPPEAGELHVLEWSPDQEAFNIQGLKAAVEENLQAFREGRPTSFHPVGLFPSLREASAACEPLMRIRNAREGGEQGDTLECEDDEI